MRQGITFLSLSPVIRSVNGPRIAVTGTPGCGKTTLCEGLASTTVSVATLAAQHNCLGPSDVEDDASPVDIELLNERIEWPEGSPLWVDGHLSHLLAVDAIVLLRCHPEALQQRLESRGYTETKVTQKVESELSGLIAAECEGRPCLELDSADSIADLIDAVKAWTADGFKPSRPHATIDWIALIHDGD
jgi:adenylate kinase